MDNTIRRLIFQLIDGTISHDDFESLQDAIEQDDEVRTAYLSAVGLNESLHEIAAESAEHGSNETYDTQSSSIGSKNSSRWRLNPPQWSVAAAATLIISVSAFWIGVSSRRNTSESISGVPHVVNDSEQQLAGHATIRSAVGVSWADEDNPRREGDVLPNGPLAFDEGITEIDFFCGATLIIEGPAKLEIVSDWSVRVEQGRLRANVPPAARGFVIEAAGSEIIDLGTEFALEVDDENAHVKVIDGEVELRGGPHDGKHLMTGESESLRGNKVGNSDFAGLSTTSDIFQKREAKEKQIFEDWKSYSQELQRDERLIAYYPIAANVSGRTVENAAATGNQRDGLLIGPIEQSTGRFGSNSNGLKFHRPGARIRTRIEGDFEAFTFACWVRIDSLEHRYNALFMADSYENGEPHWQIRDDGRLMLSVMVDDSKVVEHFSEIDQKIVQQAGLHRVYYSPAIWDVSKSGQWFHLVAVYDPVNRQVQQYVNGQQVSSDRIVDKFFIDQLRIGAAEIGNWGQPFRKTPWFAVRNLNGAIDEMAVFNAALTPDEISDIFEQGKPVGY